MSQRPPRFAGEYHGRCPACDAHNTFAFGFAENREPLENDQVRLVFSTTPCEIEEGSAIAPARLYNLETQANPHAHPIFAGPSVNAALRSLYNPSTRAKPHPGIEGTRPS